MMSYLNSVANSPFALNSLTHLPLLVIVPRNSSTQPPQLPQLSTMETTRALFSSPEARGGLSAQEANALYAT